MWTRVALIAVLAAASADTASAAVFSVPAQFWRPVSGAPPQAVVRIDETVITAAVPCAVDFLRFRLANGKPAFVDRFAYEFESDSWCEPSLAAFDAFSHRLRDIAGVLATGSSLVLQDAKGGTLMVLEPVAPKGFEFRKLTVTAFRRGGALRPLKQRGNAPYLIFFSGRIGGTAGCGALAFSRYRSLGGTRFDMSVNALVDGGCSDDTASGRQAGHVMDALNGIRNVSALPMGEFELRDDKGDVQAILSPLTAGDQP